MSLFFHLLIHFSLSLLAGFLVWQKYRTSLWLGLAAALTAGFAVDLDHVIDYFLAFGFNFNLSNFLSGLQFLKSDKIYVLFHAWEYVIIMLSLVWLINNKRLKAVFLALSLGLFLHLSADVMLNEFPFKSYGLSYRAANNFNLQRLVTEKHYQKHLELKAQAKF